MNPIKLSVIFSFRNEEEVIPELVKRTRGALNIQREKGILSDFELIFVNDASSDRSLEILAALGKGNHDIRVINMSRRFGVAPCIQAGLKYSTGDAVVYMDSDLQDPPEVIPELISAWRSGNGVDVVHTVRRSRKGESRIKLLITRVGYAILNKSAEVHLPKEAGDFKLLSRKAVNQILRFPEKNPYIRGLVCWMGFKQAFVEYDRHARVKGRTKFPVLSFDVINNFLESALISCSSLPLRLVIYAGIFSILLSAVFVGTVLWGFLAGKLTGGSALLMAAIVFFGSIQLMCTGIIGVYINSIFKNTQQRPDHIVESMYGYTEDGQNVSLGQVRDPYHAEDVKAHKAKTNIY